MAVKNSVKTSKALKLCPCNSPEFKIDKVPPQCAVGFKKLIVAIISTLKPQLCCIPIQSSLETIISL